MWVADPHSFSEMVDERRGLTKDDRAQPAPTHGSSTSSLGDHSTDTTSNGMRARRFGKISFFKINPYAANAIRNQPTRQNLATAKRDVEFSFSSCGIPLIAQDSPGPADAFFIVHRESCPFVATHYSFVLHL